MGQQESSVFEDGFSLVQDKISQVHPACCCSRRPALELDSKDAWSLCWISASCGYSADGRPVTLIHLDKMPRLVLAFEGEQQRKKWLKWLEHIEQYRCPEPDGCAPVAILPLTAITLDRCGKATPLPVSAWTERLHEFSQRRVGRLGPVSENDASPIPARVCRESAEPVPAQPQEGAATVVTEAETESPSCGELQATPVVRSPQSPPHMDSRHQQVLLDATLAEKLAHDEPHEASGAAGKPVQSAAVFAAAGVGQTQNSLSQHQSQQAATMPQAAAHVLSPRQQGRRSPLRTTAASAVAAPAAGLAEARPWTASASQLSFVGHRRRPYEVPPQQPEESPWIPSGLPEDVLRNARAAEEMRKKMERRRALLENEHQKQ
mmetsp:Transcript_9128/g.20324  ORF Transcript_9128/g.20324 Transcript_9128/m.20324 type:complete len:377 (-) Transcript_9128:67-1197(-)|eukprot:CAMPEP_0178407508 /NCGR_PEP_ID=MMETSP0689_2-20121128/19465_1 /TAXON_ID=160604 /ORGANISM="Amphidinium massartii, Strain CS-259" /LENGTH=376 /DNA_ID=CAMNT_0020028585 /DNA_START=46 /DNA_END=1176 /DNA_ORIENTATION=+